MTPVSSDYSEGTLVEILPGSLFYSSNPEIFSVMGPARYSG
jgi:hypothetical protein